MRSSASIPSPRTVRVFRPKANGTPMIRPRKIRHVRASRLPDEPETATPASGRNVLPTRKRPKLDLVIELTLRERQGVFFEDRADGGGRCHDDRAGPLVDTLGAELGLPLRDLLASPRQINAWRGGTNVID